MSTPRKKQPRPVAMEDLLEGQSGEGRTRLLGRTPAEMRRKFMTFVTKQPDGCWIWTGSINKSKGYGVASCGKGFLAHRVSYILFIGTIPLGVLVLHTCDVRPCVNPAHFFLGTDGDNARDKQGLSQAAIAERFDVTQANISCVLRGKTWAHV